MAIFSMRKADLEAEVSTRLHRRRSSPINNATVLEVTTLPTTNHPLLVRDRPRRLCARAVGQLPAARFLQQPQQAQQPDRRGRHDADGGASSGGPLGGRAARAAMEAADAAEAATAGAPSFANLQNLGPAACPLAGVGRPGGH